jgi:FHA domain-containing protein
MANTTFSNTIAWLIPSAGNRWAAEAMRMPQNASRRIDVSPCFDSIPEDNEQDDASASERDEDGDRLSFGSPRSALSLSFDHRPRGLRGFVIGTDPKSCDIVLPKVRGVSRRHCHITFDSEKRLVLRDTSKHGTTVWYDGRNNGCRRAYTWLLSSGFSYGFPAAVGRIIIDIQNIRLQIVVNACMTQSDIFQAQVEDFMMAVSPVSLLPRNDPLLPAPLRIQRPVLVKYTVAVEEGSTPETYLWNAARPWEPMVKARD